MRTAICDARRVVDDLCVVGFKVGLGLGLFFFSLSADFLFGSRSFVFVLGVCRRLVGFPTKYIKRVGKKVAPTRLRY